jgi:hypothetical protein
MEEHKLLEYKVSRKTFGPIKVEVSEQFRILHKRNFMTSIDHLVLLEQ